VAQFFLEAFQWHGVKRGDAFAFYAGDIRVEGPHPFCSKRRQFAERAHPYAMYTDSMEQLRGTAGARQVRVRAETALAAFTTPSSGGWIHVRQIPELTAGDTGDHRLAAIILSRVQCYWSKSNAWYRVRRSADTARRRFEFVALAVGCAPLPAVR
jgi:hypothetical protein